MTNTNESAYGRAAISPATPVTVGSYRCWEVTHTVGELGMDDGSTLKIAANMTSDWGVPQFNEPAAENYAMVKTSGPAEVDASYDPQGHVRPWKQTVTIDVYDGSLDEGDTITLTLGDRSEGSLGHQAQTFVEEDFRIAVLVDAFGTGEFVKLPGDITFDVLPGMADAVVAVAPSTAGTADDVTISVRVEDFWGNTATGYDGSFTVAADGTTKQRLNVREGTGEAIVSPDEPGVHRLTVKSDDGELVGTTNPVVVDDDRESLYWGDIHGQSGETVGTGDIWDYLEYARDNAFLDFTSHAGNDFQITDDFWDEIQSAIDEFHTPNEFVTFLCYEWSANTSRGGDHNVYFRDGDGDINRSSSWQIADGDDKHQGTHPVERLYEQYSGRDDVLIIPHQGGRPATLDTFDPDLSPFVEIVSVWGVFEWFGQEALERGYPVGFVGGSDDHTGRPGATHPTNQTDFNVAGGLMAVRSGDLSRDSLWDAFKHRRCYATTGARIFLETDVAGAGMGEAVSVKGSPEVDVVVEGTAPLSQVELFRGTERTGSRRFDEGDDVVEFTWSGARSRTRHKVQDWSGGLSIDAGRIVEAEEFGFDHPEQGINTRTDTTLQWDGSTSGNYQGVRVRFDAPEDATLAFSTPPVDTTFTFSDLNAATTIDVGHLDQQLKVRRVGDFLKQSARPTFIDEDAETGEQPYYVRVTQEDGEMAWSSPIFVDVS